jgi:uncharacterized membrane protein HdeD (DUF308 family)
MQRPRSVTIISWIFIIFGAIALLSGVIEIGGGGDLKSHWYVHLSRLLQIVAGIFMLFGRNWARWLLVAWIAFHIVVGALHGPLQLVLHVAIFSVILFFIFRRQASDYFLAPNTR